MKKCFLLGALLALCASAWAQNDPWRDESLPIETRVEDLLGRLTVDEKIDLQERMGYADNLHRDVEVVYWNDETNSYYSGTFYLPDITFSIMDFDDDTIHYNPISLELIEN